MTRTVEVPPERLARWLAGFTERHGGSTTETGPDMVHLTGADGEQAWLAVPFPPLAGSLVEHALRERTVGVLLARRGGYAAGVFEGPRLVSSKVGSSYVQGTTKAGGWSQQRFARRREGQARELAHRAADVAARILLERPLELVVTGGDRRTVEAVLADPRLAGLRIAEQFLTVPDPRRQVLEDSQAAFRAVRITLDP